jgi:hypothetical protein
MENSIAVPQKTKNRTTIDPAMPILGIYPKEYNSGYNRYTCILIYIVALFTIAKL